MASNKYCEYFDVNESYFPCIDESAINAGAPWETTYPHETFIELLNSTEKMLGGTTNRSIWIHGAYGTGKSQCAYALKKILEVPENEVRAYWDKSYLFGNVSRFGWLSSGGVMSRAKMFYDQTKRKEGLIAGNDFVTLDEVQTISFTDTDEMRAALKGYLEQGNFTVGDYKGVADAGVILCGNIRKEIMDADGYSNMFTELPVVFHESALIERFHGFIKGWNIPRMNDDLKVDGWALNSEYFCAIMHELRGDMTYRSIVDELIIVPDGADTRDTEAVKRISTAYLKLLFPHVQNVSDISPREFKRCELSRFKGVCG